MLVRANAGLGASPDCIKWLYYSKRILLLDGLTLAIFFSLIFVGKMCVFVSRPMKIATFLLQNDYSPKRVVDFPLERDFPKQIHGNRRGF